MLMPEVHSCAQLVTENEKLKKALRKVRRENEETKKSLAAINEEKKISAILKQFVTTRDSGVQTDPVKPVAAVKSSYSYQPVTGKKIDKPSETDKLNKMMMLNNNLMKRYEKELRVNMEHLETITTLNLKLSELQQKLTDSEKNHHQSEVIKGSTRPGCATRKDKLNVDELVQELKDVKKERVKITKENKKLKQEIKGLDMGFFEEIEDIKYALLQSAKLNKEYESCLKKMCKQFGVPYPNPEKLLERKQ